jgi:serine phosphatase RsbU (regulator of sigma subunit)
MMYSSWVSSLRTKETHACFLLLFTVAFLLLPSYCYSQSIKELEENVKTVSSKEKPMVLNQISSKYLKIDANKSISFAEQALKASRKQDNVLEEATALITLAKAYEILNKEKKTIQYYKEAIKVFDENGQLSNSANLWTEIAAIFLFSKNYTEALDAEIKALELYKKTKDKRSILSVNLAIGDIYFILQKYENSLPSFRIVLKMYEDLNDVAGQVMLLKRIGNSYKSWGNFDESYIFFNQALDIAKKNNLDLEEAFLSETIETVKKNLSNWQKSKIEYDLQVQKEQKEQKEKAREQERQIKIKEKEINSLANQNIKSIEEIENLSGNAQLKELKIKAQQEEIFRKKMESESQLKTNEFLKKKQELSELEVEKQKILIWGGAGFSVLGLILSALIFFAYRNKKKANDLQKQKNEIIYKQKEQIEQKNTLITDSIDYAKNIQDAILPSQEPLSKHFSDFFIFYKPKDIVSGDFFWIKDGESKDNCVCIAAADCTGHGVPGAFMSLLGFIMLDDIAKSSTSNNTPADVLKEVNNQLMSVLHQNTDNLTGKFGMDIALLKYNIHKNEIIYSGAHNPLIIIGSDGHIHEIKADKISIGTRLDCSFTNHTIKVNKGDMVYLYSDGYQDQIGGERRKKYLSYNLKELLKKIHLLDADKQKEELTRVHLEWRSKTDQTDDILFIGLKI